MFGRRSTVAAAPTPTPTPTFGIQCRTVRAAAVIPRPRPQVWEEISQPDHPAWSDGSETGRYNVIGNGTGVHVGDAKVIGPMIMPPFGLRQVWWEVVTNVTPGWMVTVETYAGFFEHTETLVFEDHPDGTYARIEGMMRRVSTPEVADQIVTTMTQLAQEHLRRAAEWTPGIGARPVIIRPLGF